jgi:hypothetical protein
LEQIDEQFRLIEVDDDPRQWPPPALTGNATRPTVDAPRDQRLAIRDQ